MGGGGFHFIGGGCKVLKPCRGLCPFVLCTLCSALVSGIRINNS